MSREHKYRGLTKGGELVYGYYVKTNENIHWIVPMNCFGNLLSRLASPKKVDPATVGEFTGTRDSKRTAEFPQGQEIYEGDNLHIWSSFYKVDVRRAEVFWNEKLMKFDLKMRDGKYKNLMAHLHESSWQCEVIGNIHRPEGE